MGGRSVIAENRSSRLERIGPERTHPSYPGRTPGAAALGSGSCSCAPDTVRVEAGAVTEHRAGDVQRAVGHRARGTRVAASPKRPVLVVAGRIAFWATTGARW